MTFGQLIAQFFHDDKLKIALLLIAVDFVLGVIAAVKLGNFRLSYVADFGRNDILFKLIPWFVLYSAALVAGNASLGPFDVGDAAGSVYVVMLAAWGASIAGSLAELGLPGGRQSLRLALTGAENDAPPRD